MKSGTRKLRNALGLAIRASGVVAILVGAWVADDAVSRAGLTVIGIVLLLIHTVGLEAMVLPSERRFGALRTEVDKFVLSVRRLNRAGVRAARSDQELPAFHAAREDLLQGAKSVADVAASTHGLHLPTAKL